MLWDGLGEYEKAEGFKLAALEGRRRVLGEEHKDTLDSLSNMGVVLLYLKDYEGALDYNQQALRARERVLGKTHPSTLMTAMSMACMYMEGMNHFTNAEEMLTLALDGDEMSLGMDHDETRKCAFNLARLYAITNSTEKRIELLKRHPHLLSLLRGGAEIMRGPHPPLMTTTIYLKETKK